MTRAVLIVCLSVALSACSVTQQAPLKASATGSGLVDYSLLKAGAPGQAELRYVNPAAQWTRYKKVLIEPVTYWSAHGDTRISPADQHALCNYFQQALQQQFGKYFTLVSQDGPGVMVLAVALTDAEAATPVLRSVSMLVPQARVLATLKYLATGSYPFIGSAQVAARLSDSETGTVLGEWVDRRIGGGSVTTAAQWQWGDAENAITQWSTTAATKVAAWTSGSQTP
jgi:hypothetical protein